TRAEPCTASSPAHRSFSHTPAPPLARPAGRGLFSPLTRTSRPRPTAPERFAMRPTSPRRTRIPSAALAALLLGTAPFAAAPALAQGVDTAYTRLVAEATSDPAFLPASVATIPEHATVPSPRDHFGTIAGAEGVMHRSAELYGYYRALA